MAKIKNAAFIARELTNEFDKSFAFGSSSVKLTDSQLKAVIGGYTPGDDGGGGGGGTPMTGTINGCVWKPSECWCKIDILGDNGIQYCEVDAAYHICMEVCQAEPCHIIA